MASFPPNKFIYTHSTYIVDMKLELLIYYIQKIKLIDA